MEYKTRSGKTEGKDSLQDCFLQAVYGHWIGRLLIRPLIGPSFSRAGGRVMDSKWSASLIGPFVRTNGIDLSECKKTRFDSYNDFFTRELKEEARPADRRPEAFISPCDGKLSVYRIGRDLRVPVKNTWYRTEELLRDRKLARRFEGGLLLVFRLSVDDYHRYVYIDDGYQSGYRRIRGCFHTVNPAANDVCPIYKENSREYSILLSAHFGPLLVMEVGAMLVGRIENHPGHCDVRRGEEKGNFAYGGSTIVVMVQKDRLRVDEDILANTKEGYETKVRQGERIGIGMDSGK